MNYKSYTLTNSRFYVKKLNRWTKTDTVDDRQYIYQARKSLSKVISKPVYKN